MSTTLTIGSLHISPPLILAPMAGISDLPFRLLAREQGAPLCFTEMISAEGLKRNGKNTLALLQSSSSDRPLGIQLFGGDPASLAEAARMIESDCDLIDINMGCPVKKVVSGGAGSSLLRAPHKVAEIIRSVRKATSRPLTIKIRTGWNATEQSFLEIGRIAEQEGCDAITLHPRTRAQMFSDHAEWEKIKELKNATTLPIIGSGDIFSSQDVVEMFSQTGCDGVMIARGAMGNPWIFREALARLAGNTPASPSSEERRITALSHLEQLCALYGEYTAVAEMRKHLSWYVKGLAGAARFRSLVNTLGEMEKLRQAITDFFSLVEHE
ncbi:MAG: tRNA dihydrouridine synthase DusB [Geobacteraceae bacterium]|jgi:tRNA-dihydrouridine synthase B